MEILSEKCPRRITSPFGGRQIFGGENFHRGLDIAAPLCLEDGTGRPTAELDNAYFRTKETNA